METKRAYGSGSIYQRSSDGRWVAAYRANGKRKVHTSKNKADVEQWLAEQPVPPRPSKEPYWVLEREAGPYSPNTYQETLEKLRTQNGKCRYCERVLHSGWERDHIVPLARGGGNENANLAVCCTPCNRAKGDRTGDEFMAWAQSTSYFRGLPPLPVRKNMRAKIVAAVRNGG